MNLLLNLGVALAYALFVTGISLVISQVYPDQQSWFIGLVVFLGAFLLEPMRIALNKSVNRMFNASLVPYLERLGEFNNDVSGLIDLPSIIGLLRNRIRQDLDQPGLHIFLFDDSSQEYTAVPGEDGKATTDIRFTASSALVSYLLQNPVYNFSEEGTPSSLDAERQRLVLLGAALFSRLSGGGKILGWVALDGRGAEKKYSPEEVRHLEELCSLAALGVERGRIVADLEKRVRELDVLTRMAQGVNITMAFDDLLELIYAQTISVIPASDFRVVLKDEINGALYFGFYVRDNDRIREIETIPIVPGQELEEEIFKSPQGLLTNHYQAECRRKGYFPMDGQLVAWLGVPMLAGADTIGALSLGSRGLDSGFVIEQKNLLQAIADQASGAIVKARLLQETQKRARQLALLNEIGRSLTSTLDLKRLLDQIIRHSVELLGCEVGCLLMLDGQMGELVLEAVTDASVVNVKERRVPLGVGIAGTAANSGKPVIANQLVSHPEFHPSGLEMEMNARDALVAPMTVQDRIIGVIEVFNKFDGRPFSKDDLGMLTTFTSQAAVAIENARLYTLTDQALAARLEEMAALQLIDTELNATLEIDRAMQITLESAMRQGKVDTGWIGLVEGGEICIMAARGYSDRLQEYLKPADENPLKLSLETRGIHDVIRNGTPMTFEANPIGDFDEQGVIEGRISPNRARVLVVPIRREADVIGVVTLEKIPSETWTPETLAFLSRLCDHAAIAIANAQLYHEVNAANLAKSKFVSFVAHELKNPMASIKGYTELVINGMAGPVNEMQVSFLSTVRSNVERMNTIVSDLNDLTKIQVGNLRLDFQTVRIKDIVDEAIHGLRRQIDEKHQQLSVELQENLPPVWADPLRLGQVLTNLISNAQKYTPAEGSISICADVISDSHKSPAGLNFVHLWVKDSGIGIPLKDQGSIFEQYFRTEISKETASGTGLGLNITRSLVEMQGGRIWFESELGEGSIFHFTIPSSEAS